jgi:hypothetical protein
VLHRPVLSHSHLFWRLGIIFQVEKDDHLGAECERGEKELETGREIKRGKVIERPIEAARQQ